MSLRTYLEELKQKPDAHKKKVALVASAVITGLIALIWLASFRFLPAGNSNKDLKTETTSPITEVKTTILSGVGEMLSSVDKAKTGLKEAFAPAVSNKAGVASPTVDPAQNPILNN